MMQKAVMVSALASGQGKTILTAAILSHFKNRDIQPFKAGPDYIDTQFHKRLCGVDSVNLDRFMMDDLQLKWVFDKYAKGKISIAEGVMGYYDGIEQGSSTYDVAKALGIPVLLILDGGGSYSTLVAVMEGILCHKKDNTIKAVVFNRLSSKSHFALLKELFLRSFPNIAVLGWIKKDLQSLSSRHLGLDLCELDGKAVDEISVAALENIDMEALERAMEFLAPASPSYPFCAPIGVSEKRLCVVCDENFSFLYKDNIEFFKETFKTVDFVSVSKDEPIPSCCDSLFIPGGYVETVEAYAKIKEGFRFKKSLQNFKGKVYAECAGLMYLGRFVKSGDDILPMCGILDLEFEMKNSRIRLGYYEAYDKISADIFRGHAFHYSDAVSDGDAAWELAKVGANNPKAGGWQKGNFFGTYLHSMFRASPKLVEKYF